MMNAVLSYDRATPERRTRSVDRKTSFWFKYSRPSYHHCVRKQQRSCARRVSRYAKYTSAADHQHDITSDDHDITSDDRDSRLDATFRRDMSQKHAPPALPAVSDGDDHTWVCVPSKCELPDVTMRNVLYASYIWIAGWLGASRST